MFLHEQSFLHEASLFIGVILARNLFFAPIVNFARRYFSTGLYLVLANWLKVPPVILEDRNLDKKRM